MKHAWLLVVAVACKKDPAATPPAAQSAPSKPAAASDAALAATGSSVADAGVARVELLHAVPSTVTVSSTVNNRTIKPAHLVDRNFETAWNSATGELAGAWVEIKVAPGSTIEEVRMTVGHTGHSAKGADYFTMNPRIRRVSLSANNKTLGPFTLDTSRRDLQRIPVHTAERVRITIEEVVPGTKKSWREAAISELEVWGTPPAGWKPPATPLVPTVEVAEPEPAPDDPCAETDAEREKFIAAHENDDNSGPGGEDHSYPPTCDTLDLGQLQGAADPVPAFADAVGFCVIQDEIYGPKTCTVRVGRTGASGSVEISADDAKAEVRVARFEQRDVIPGGRPELVVELATDEKHVLAVCRAEPTIGCTDAFTIEAGSWKVHPRFSGGRLQLDADSGTPPADVVGAHVLAFGK